MGQRDAGATSKLEREDDNGETQKAIQNFLDIEKFPLGADSLADPSAITLSAIACHSLGNNPHGSCAAGNYSDRNRFRRPEDSPGGGKLSRRSRQRGSDENI